MEDWDEVVFEGISQLQATDGDLGPVEAAFVYKREGKKVGQTQRMSEAKLVAVIENLRKAGRVVPEAYKKGMRSLGRKKALIAGERLP